MSDIAIRCEGLGKQYRIGRRERYKALRDKLTEAMYAPIRHARGAFSRNGYSPAKSDDTIWALKDVSFEIKHGEVVGVIGRNGAGKSTLLKILSRITEPTTGQIAVHGRVGSLLEVGTGFHPELTGRENIYLNGAILGMRKEEVVRKFDEIVAFAEIEGFLDTPVKHYSSGMHMRLAFAVAAHLEPEILVVDEVLAVGDAAFQKKCLGKMSEVAQEGRTVLFVSHNMGAVSHLCTKSFVLEKGSISYSGNVGDAIDFYSRKLIGMENGLSKLAPHVIYDFPEGAKNYEFAVTRIETLDTSYSPKPTIATWDDVIFRIWFSCKRSLQRGSVVMEIYGLDGYKLLLLSTEPDGTTSLDFKLGEQYVDCLLEQFPFAGGEYVLGAGLAIPNVEWLWHKRELANLTVLPKDVYNCGLAATSSRSLVAVRHQWRTIS